MSGERLFHGSGFEVRPIQKSLGLDLVEREGEKDKQRLYKYHPLLLGALAHSIYADHLITPNVPGRKIQRAIPSQEYISHLDRLSDETNLTASGTGRRLQAGQEVYRVIAKGASAAADKTRALLPQEREGWKLSGIKPEFLFRPSHIMRIHELFGNEDLLQFAEDEGYPPVEELIAEAITSPDFKLPVKSTDIPGQWKDTSLGIESMYAMLRTLPEAAVDGSKILQLIQLLAYSSSYLWFDFTRDKSIDLRKIKDTLHKSTLSGTARADAVALYHRSDRPQDEKLIDRYFSSLAEGISPFNYGKMDNRTFEDRMAVMEGIRNGEIASAVIEVKTEFQDEQLTRDGYKKRPFVKDAIPQHHYADMATTLFAVYQHLARLYNFKQGDPRNVPELVTFMAAHMEGQTAYRQAARGVRRFRESFFGPTNHYIVARLKGDLISAQEAYVPAVRKGANGPWYGLRASELGDTEIDYSVLNADTITLRHAILKTAEKLAVNATLRDMPVDDTRYAETLQNEDV